MHYAVSEGHGLPHDPFRAIVAPRPIGWISTCDFEGRVNLAPYSFFNAFSARPPMVGFSSEGQKDSLANIRQTSEFVVNIATRPMAEQMNETSRALARGVDEMTMFGIAPAPSRFVRPPRVAQAPAALECRMVNIVDLRGLDGKASDRWLTIAEVVGIYIDDAFVKDGLFDMTAARVIARCGYFDYAEISSLFQMNRPDSTGH